MMAFHAKKIFKYRGMDRLELIARKMSYFAQAESELFENSSRLEKVCTIPVFVETCFSFYDCKI